MGLKQETGCAELSSRRASCPRPLRLAVVTLPLLCLPWFAIENIDDRFGLIAFGRSWCCCCLCFYSVYLVFYDRGLVIMGVWWWWWGWWWWWWWWCVVLVLVCFFLFFFGLFVVVVGGCWCGWCG